MSRDLAISHVCIRLYNAEKQLPTIGKSQAAPCQKSKDSRSDKVDYLRTHAMCHVCVCLVQATKHYKHSGD